MRRMKIFERLHEAIEDGPNVPVQSEDDRMKAQVSIKYSDYGIRACVLYE